jgi:hypothetical protein
VKGDYFTRLTPAGIIRCLEVQHRLPGFCPVLGASIPPALDGGRQHREGPGVAPVIRKRLDVAVVQCHLPALCAPGEHLIPIPLNACAPCFRAYSKTLEGQWRQDGVVILGRTATGRAAVVALSLNNLVAVTVRRTWVTVGWHPPPD